MDKQTDIISLEDVKNLVDTFYTKVQLHPVLSPVFNERIKDKWPQHLEKMYSFWQTILLEEYTYFGRPFPPHAQLPVDAIHFEAWLQLFNQTVDELFIGDKATEAKWRANKMAEMFQIKLAHFRGNSHNIL
ncbi:group III truncated hemoglobin [Mucilaginibacter limnophilus]|uniref:Group III truncated hemoglobin n=1 Tax=Mucilaginibacter limnophilus TaxID=1932778 RepID=A0A3S3TG44_9SPHI|nr:group III truncated hemoglobin [Mucilaginibacter limnophilus]RVU00307.1 group III truncated hemoglobin [Mucilaginibacter limnophilus]